MAKFLLKIPYITKKYKNLQNWCHFLLIHFVQYTGRTEIRKWRKCAMKRKFMALLLAAACLMTMAMGTVSAAPAEAF